MQCSVCSCSGVHTSGHTDRCELGKVNQTIVVDVDGSKCVPQLFHLLAARAKRDCKQRSTLQEAVLPELGQLGYERLSNLLFLRMRAIPASSDTHKCACVWGGELM